MPVQVKFSCQASLPWAYENISCFQIFLDFRNTNEAFWICITISVCKESEALQVFSLTHIVQKYEVRCETQVTLPPQHIIPHGLDRDARLSSVELPSVTWFRTTTMGPESYLL